MEIFELRRSRDDLHLTGGSFTEALIFPAAEPEAPIRLVGFLSQRNGSVLTIIGRHGEIAEIQRRPATGIMPGAVGGLAGPLPSLIPHALRNTPKPMIRSC